MCDAFELLVGGGMKGWGIGRAAASRGLFVLLVEKGDLGGATSPASSKLIPGGLRYLEQREFRLVREPDRVWREEWARRAEDLRWRRSRPGLHLGPGARAAVAVWFGQLAPRGLPPVPTAG